MTRAIERVEERIFRKPLEPPPHPKPAAAHTWHAADGKPAREAPARRAAAQPREEGVLTARSIQLKAVLAPEQILRLHAPDGQPRVKLSVAYEGGTLSTEVAAKSVRKAQSTIRAAGVQDTFVMLQGKLARGEIREAGLVTQPKTPPKTDQ